uniref:Uncharacterized protein n=1 Tax=Lepeophtheirus salmonis TaxID=72036 RepID=A0A0K2VLI5_LEPSM
MISLATNAISLSMTPPKSFPISYSSKPYFHPLAMTHKNF